MQATGPREGQETSCAAANDEEHQANKQDCITAARGELAVQLHRRLQGALEFGLP